MKNAMIKKVSICMFVLIGTFVGCSKFKFEGNAATLSAEAVENCAHMTDQVCELHQK